MSALIDLAANGSEKGIMERISLPYIFELALQIDHLGSLPGSSADNVQLGDIYFRLVFANTSLESLLQTNVISPYLRICAPLGRRLKGEIEKLLAQKVDSIVPSWELSTLMSSYGSFKIALLAELESFNTYITTNKGAYDMFSLLTNGDVLFPHGLAQKVPDALADARQAARALAFEMPTACGFHVFRATETVLRSYYHHVSGSNVKPKSRNMSVYVQALEKSGKADAKIISALKQMINLHRNPLVHPEVNLDTEEAISTLGIARSVMTVMLAAIPPVLQAI